MLTKESREDLKWAMKAHLLEQASVLQEGRDFVQEFVMKEATYEQLLNLCFNPKRDDVYLESEVLEKVAFDLFGMTKKTVQESTDAVEMLEEGEKWDNVKGAVEKGAKEVAKKVAGVKNAGHMNLKKGARAAVGRAIKNNPKTAAALAAGGVAAGGVGTALAYKKMRNKGKTKKEAAELALQFAQDDHTKQVWQERLERYSAE